MTLWILLWVYLLVHCVLCVLIYMGMRTRFLKCTEQLMPIVALVPVVGMAVCLVADYHSRFHKAGIKPIDLEELHLEKNDLRLQRIETAEGEELVLPLEEAMSINDASTRRRLMLDILHQNPQEYIELLQEARLDEDIEVTHYASTAIMEMQRDFELSLQKAEKAFGEDSGNSEKLERYLHTLRRYIESGLVDQNVLFIYRSRYAELLRGKMSREPEDMDACLQAVDNYLYLENYSEAKALADRLVGKWPGREETWFAQIKVLQQMRDGAGIRAAAREVKRRGVYLSPEGRASLAFWDRDDKPAEGKGEAHV